MPETMKPCREFDAACDKLEDRYGFDDTNVRFHDVGALRGYCFLVFSAWQAAKADHAESGNSCPRCGSCGHPCDCHEGYKAQIEACDRQIAELREALEAMRQATSGTTYPENHPIWEANRLSDQALAKRTEGL